MSVEEQFEQNEKKRLELDAKVRQVQKTGVLPGSTAEKLERIRNLRENAGFFAEGSALTTVQKILCMQEETVRLKETLNEFAEDQTSILNGLASLKQEIASLGEAVKETNGILRDEFKARSAARAREQEVLAELSAYINQWK